MPFTDRHRSYFTTLHSIEPPRIMTTLAWMLVSASMLAIAFLAFTPWVQTAAGAGVDLEDQSAGYGMHGDQERLRESEFQRFVRFNWELVTRLAAAR